MTSPVTNANVVLTADVSQYQTQMQAAGASTQKLIDGLDKLQNGIDGVFKRAGTRLELFSAGQAATVTGMVASLANLNAELRTVSATSALAGGTDVPKLAAGLRQISTQIPVSTRDLASLAVTINGLGVQGNRNIQSLTRTFAELGAATGEGANQLASSLIQLVRSQGEALDPQRMNQYASALANLDAKMGVSATSVAQFAQAIQPMARLLGQTTTEILGVSAAFVKAGADGYVAANTYAQIATMIVQDVNTGNPQLRTFAQMLGLTNQAFVDLQRTNPTQVMNGIIQAIGRMPQGQQLAMVQGLGLGGPREVQAIVRLYQQQGLQQGVQTAAQGAAHPEDLTKAAAASFHDLENELKRFGQSMLAITSGPFMQLTHGLTNIVGWLNSLIQIFQKFINLPGVHFMVQAFGDMAAVAIPLTAIAGILTKMIPLLLRVSALWLTLFSRPSVSLMTGARDALQGVNQGLAGTGQGATAIQRGLYNIGQRIGYTAAEAGIQPGVLGRLRGRALSALGGAAGWGAETFIQRPIGIMGAEARAYGMGGTTAAQRAVYERQPWFPTWPETQAGLQRMQQRVSGFIGGPAQNQLIAQAQERLSGSISMNLLQQMQQFGTAPLAGPASPVNRRALGFFQRFRVGLAGPPAEAQPPPGQMVLPFAQAAQPQQGMLPGMEAISQAADAASKVSEAFDKTAEKTKTFGDAAEKAGERFKEAFDKFKDLGDTVKEYQASQVKATESQTADTEATTRAAAGNEEVGGAAPRAAVGLNDVALAAAKAAAGLGGAAVSGGLGLGMAGGRLIGRGVGAAGAGIAGALMSNPIGWGITGAMVAATVVPMAISAESQQGQTAVEATQGSWLQNLNAMNAIAGKSAMTLDDLKNAAADAAKKLNNIPGQPGAGGGAAAAPTPAAPAAWSPAEIQHATDAAFQAVGYNPKTKATQDQKLAQLLQTQMAALSQPGAGPLTQKQQDQFRQDLEHLLGPSGDAVNREKAIYNSVRMSTGGFTHAATNMQQISDVFGTGVQNWERAMDRSLNPLPYRSRGAEHARGDILTPLQALSTQWGDITGTSPMATAQRQVVGGQTLAGIAGIVKQINQGQAAGTLDVDQIHSMYREMAKNLGFKADVGNVTNFNDFVRNAYKDQATTAARIFPQGVNVDWSNPASILGYAQGITNIGQWSTQNINQQQAALNRRGGPGSMFAALNLGMLGGAVQPGMGLVNQLSSILGPNATLAQDPTALAQTTNALAQAITSQGNSAEVTTRKMTEWAGSLKNLTPDQQAAVTAVESLTNAILDMNQATMSTPQQLGNIASRIRGLSTTDPNYGTNLNNLVQQGTQVMQSGYQAAQQYVMSLDNLQVQQNRSTYDFNLNQGRQRTQFKLQTDRQIHDYYQSQQWATDAFHRQQDRSNKEFGIQQLQNQQSFQRQQDRQRRDFDHQTQLYVRQVAQSLDPFAQVQAQDVPDAAQVLQNMSQQNQMFATAGNQLNQLRRMGLNQSVIDVLGLSDPANMQKLNRFFTDVAQNPQLIKAFNQSIKGRLDWTTGLATNQSSTQWREMVYQFHTAANDAVKEFTIANQQTAAAFKRQQDNAVTDFGIQMNQNAITFKQSMDRQAHDFGVSMDQMATDQKTSMDRALEDVNRFNQTAYADSAKILKQAMDRSKGDIHKFFADFYQEVATFQGLVAQAAAQAGAAPGGGGAGGPLGSAGNPNVTPGTLGINPSGQVGTYNIKGKFTPAPANTFRGMTGQERIAYTQTLPHIAPPISNIAGATATQNYAFSLFGQFGWGKDQQQPLIDLWMQESGWRAGARNAGSGAFGIAQALGHGGSGTGAYANTDQGRLFVNEYPNSLANSGNAQAQIQWGLNYISGTYGNPANAWRHEKAVNWYQLGGVFRGPRLIGIGETGPEAVLPLDQHGVDFLLQLMRQANQDAFGSLLGGRYASPVKATVVNTHVDSSTNYHGPITVQAQDPNAMQRALENKKRLQALTAPDLVPATA